METRSVKLGLHSNLLRVSGTYMPAQANMRFLIKKIKILE